MMKDKDLFTLQSRSGGLKMSFRTKQVKQLVYKCTIIIIMSV